MGLPSYDVSKSPPVWLVSLRERSRMALVSFTCVYCDGVRRSGSSEIYRNVFLLVRVPVFTRTSKVFLCWWCHGGRLRTEAGAVRLTGVYVTLFLCWGDKRTFSSYDHTHTHTMYRVQNRTVNGHMIRLTIERGPVCVICDIVIGVLLPDLNGLFKLSVTDDFILMCERDICTIWEWYI